MLRAFAAQPGRTAETKGTGRRGLGISDEAFWHFLVACFPSFLMENPLISV
jgi:hypothetical protein